MNIKRKLTLSYSVLTLLLIAVVIIALSSLKRATQDFSQMIEGIQHRADLVAAIRNGVDRRAIAARNMALATAKQDYEFEKNETLAAHRETTQSIKELNESVTRGADVEDKDRSFAADINRIETLYAPVALSILDLISNNRRDAAILKMNEECRPLLRSLVSSTKAYYVYSTEKKKSLVENFYKSYESKRLILIAVAILSGFLAMIMSWLTTASIVAPINLAVSFAGKVAQGDLRETIKSDEQNETGFLLRSLNHMNTQLTATVRKVRDGSTNIAVASREIASGNIDLSERTEKQAASLQQTAASMQELTSTARQNTDNARQASELTKTTLHTAEQANVIVSGVVETMQGISANSSEIGKITGVIEGISFQTNILALNAAVEAARAGEHGKGFAVVATEVRNLAARSATAAKEIKDLLTRSVNQVENGMRRAKEAGQVVETMKQSMATVTGLAATIAFASEEQGRGIDQINMAIGQMDQVTQQNAALVEEAAAASHALQQQGFELEQAVQAFKLG